MVRGGSGGGKQAKFCLGWKDSWQDRIRGACVGESQRLQGSWKDELSLGLSGFLWGRGRGRRVDMVGVHN